MKLSVNAIQKCNPHTRAHNDHSLNSERIFGNHLLGLPANKWNKLLFI